jgi:hypothetical protein
MFKEVNPEVLEKHVAFLDKKEYRALEKQFP